MNINIINKIEPTFTKEQVVNNISQRINEYPEGFVSTLTDGARALWNEGSKIKAIKLIRTVFPMGLTDAKNFCEEKFNEPKHNWNLE